MTTAYAAELPFVDAEPDAALRLREGSSVCPRWQFTEGDRGIRIPIGADPCCDWQIAGIGVSAREGVASLEAGLQSAAELEPEET